MANEQLIFGLSSKIIEDFQLIFKEFPAIHRVFIFGSRAKGTWKDGSDIDLAIFAPELTDKEFTKLWDKVDSLPLVFKVDCIHWDRLANPDLKQKIVNEGKLFWGQT